MVRTCLLVVAAVGGAAVLAIEVLAARTMAPALGSGSIPWSVLLAVALGTLAAGNLAGGLMACRVAAGAAIAWLLVGAAGWLVVVAFCYATLVRWGLGPSLLAAAVAAAMSIQAPPLALLGAATPIILRRGQDTSGRWAGLVLAAGSGGGIVGALGTAVYLLPGVGLARSFLTLAAALAAAALPIAVRQRRWILTSLLLGMIASIVWNWPQRELPSVVQSAYGQIEVRGTPASLLLVDGLPQTGVPAELAPWDGLRQGYLLEVALDIRPQPSRALVVGLGAGLAPRILALHGIDCETVEIDPAVVQTARGQFAFRGRVTIGDGRAVLAQSNRRYDLIVLDVCTSDRLAWHLFTIEMMRILNERLAPGGVLVIQFIGDDGTWSASLARTVDAVFGRSLMLASRRETGPIGPRWLFASRGILPPDAPDSGRLPWRVLSPAAKGVVLTDDRFAAEGAWASTAAAWRACYGP
ncbi:MAG: fused MFS/spermidine synthase [Thermoguttaceae bacterium]